MNKPSGSHFRGRLSKNKNLFAKITLIAFITLVGALAAVHFPSASADSITWSNQGTTNGLCNNVSSDPSITGQQWQFLLTSPDGNGTYNLTTSFSPSTQSPSNPIVITSSGNGSVHLYVNTAIGAKLLSASVTGGTSQSNLTVSDCKVGKYSPSISTTASTGGTVGITLNDTATLSNASPSPTGSVTFNLFPPTDSTCSGTPVFSQTDSTAPYATTGGYVSNEVGVWHWTAQYSGDTNNNSASSSCSSEAVTVNKATPAISTTASGPVVVGNTISDTAHLNGGYGTLGGSLTFEVFAPSDTGCSNPISVSPTIPVSGAGDYTSGNYTTTAVGNYLWEAQYTGDINNNSLTTGCHDSNESSTVTKATPSISTTASAGGVVGISVSDSATVSGGYNPTGSVIFYLFAPGNNCSNLSSALYSETDPLSASNAGPTTGFPTSTVGTYSWEAVYSGDNNNYSATSPCTAESVTTTKASPTISTIPSNGGVIGITINDSAAVSGGYNPTGSVTFDLFGPNDQNCSGAPIYTETSLSTPYATLSGFSSNAVGVWHWTAHYSGDANNNPADSGCTAETVTITKASPSISTTDSAGGVVGVSVYDSASVTGGYNPTGTVTFYLFGPNDTCSSTATALNTETDPVVSGSAGPTLGYTTSTVGTYHWEAIYSGDNNNMPATSGCNLEFVTTTKASPTLNTVPSNGGTVGLSINDTASLLGGFNPAGSVIFNLYGPTDPNCSNAPVYTETDTSAPYATTLGYVSNAVGVWHWTAHYSGDANNNPADSGCTAEMVTTTKADPGISTIPSAGGIIGVVLNDSANLTGGYNLTGSITFKLYSPSDTNCSNTPAFTNTVNISGPGKYSTSSGFNSNAVGTWRWVASYSGDNNNTPVTGGCNAEEVTVTQVPYWCSPGFWATAIKQNRFGVLLYLSSHGVNLNAAYSSIPASLNPAKLKSGNPKTVTLSQVLSSPSTYGGQAFNSVADYISLVLGWKGTQFTGEQCPLNAQGVFTPITT